MAAAALRSTLFKVNVAGSVIWKGGSVSSASPLVVQVATLKATHGDKYPYPKKPFPYKTKRYTWWRQILDHSRSYLCENSKIITVDGNIGVGKNDFGERLSKEFDLKFFPAVEDSEIYLNKMNGLDMRMFNKFLPNTAKFYDLETFANDPDAEKVGRVALMQMHFYMEKFTRYCNALEHVLSTGQGAVIVNSVYSDDAFLETLRDCGYIKPNFHKNYYKMRDNTICELYKPHLCIYLDTPLSTVRENLKKKNDPLDSRCTDKYIQSYEKHLNRFKDNMRRSSEVMDIDWSEPVDDLDMDWIAEEISRVNLESEDGEDPKFHQWFNPSDDELDYLRVMVGTKEMRDALFKTVRITMDSPEIYWSEEDQQIVHDVVKTSPAFYGKKGYIPLVKENPYLKLW